MGGASLQRAQVPGIAECATLLGSVCITSVEAEIGTEY